MYAIPPKLTNRTIVVGLSALVVLCAVGPMLWAISTSLKNEVDAVAAIPALIPPSITFANFLTVFTHKTFLVELFNSLLYAAGAVAVALAVGIPAGYAASRFNFPAKRPLMLLILATSMVPGVALLVPTFYLLDQLGLLNNRFVVVVILAARIAPQTVWFIQNFVDAVPRDIDEAALLDGASHRQILLLLVLPLIGVWALVAELRFGRNSERLVRRLEAEGGLPVEELPIRPSGRPLRDAADAEFPMYRAAVDEHPDDWRAWFRLGLAYNSAGDRRRARGAIRTAIALERP